MTRPTIVALIGLVVATVAVVLAIRHQREETAEIEAPIPAAVGTAPAAMADKGEPSFDVVRIDAGGDTVIAGRAMPGAVVTIIDGGKELGQATADGRGEWVFLPPLPLEPGSRELKLRAANPDGTQTNSGEAVVLVVPPRGQGTAIAIKSGKDGASRILQGPAPAADAGELTLSVVDHDDKGRLIVSGKAPASAKINLYLDNRLLGHARADGSGAWKVTSSKPPVSGTHLLRADHVDGKGKVIHRVELTWTPGEETAMKPATGSTVVVFQGNSLWRIARRLYGQGMSYTVIFEANRDRIRDPDRIYPGQIFTIPEK
ncbi:MAG: LysM peptidoglycan-binding domain-containing protein [Magnetospirillum sp.]|nr:LysM peptidoglycan-binding domain-containing protein [Magnetospirillum sp.]